MSGFAPRKRFSQNFLTDPGTADKIVAALEIVPGDVVIEIGPGKGMLTERLVASSAARIIAVDVDERAIEHCRTLPWASDPRVEFVCADFLTLDLAALFSPSTRTACKVIGNIPYSITSDILFRLFEIRKVAGRAVIMMQREVARRLVADLGTKEYGILTVATTLAGAARLLFHVKPGSFFPRPDVTSSVVRFDLDDSDRFGVAMDEFMPFVRALFSQRRKVLVNALEHFCQQHLGISARSRVGSTGPIDIEKRRAEELRVEDMVVLYSELMKVPA